MQCCYHCPLRRENSVLFVICRVRPLGKVTMNHSIVRLCHTSAKLPSQTFFPSDSISLYSAFDNLSLQQLSARNFVLSVFIDLSDSNQTLSILQSASSLTILIIRFLFMKIFECSFVDSAFSVKSNVFFSINETSIFPYRTEQIELR
jgi:hypothetical protein